MSDLIYNGYSSYETPRDKKSIVLKQYASVKHAFVKISLEICVRLKIGKQKKNDEPEPDPENIHKIHNNRGWKKNEGNSIINMQQKA